MENELDMNINDLIDFDVLNKAKVSGRRLVNNLRLPRENGVKITFGSDHHALLNSLVAGYGSITGRPVAASAVVRRALEITAENLTELLLTDDSAGIRAEADALVQASRHVFNRT